MQKTVSILILLFLLLNFSACTSTKNSTNTPQKQLSPEEIRLNEIRGELFLGANDRAIKADMRKTPVQSTLKENRKFQLFLESIQAKYPYEELFEISKAFECLKQQKPKATAHKNNAFPNNEITSFEIEEVLRANNKVFLDQKKNSILKEVDSQTLTKVSKIIADTIKKVVDIYPNADIGEFKCVLSDLKLFFSHNPSFASVNEDNCMLISPNMMKIAEYKNTNKNSDTFESIITHETIHLFQVACVDNELNNGRKIGICSKGKDLKVNSLFYNWFYEASTEKNVCNILNTKPIVYEFMIGYLESISLATILNPTVNVNDTEELCFERDLNSLFQLFDCKEKEKTEILKAIYAVEIVQNQPKDFTDAYKQKYGIELDDKSYVEIKRELKSAFSITLSKYFYKFLSNACTDNKNMTLQDVFYLITISEADVNSHIEYIDPAEKFEYNKIFMKEYIGIQNNFFGTLASAGLSKDEITNKFYNYALNIENDKSGKGANCDLYWLSEDKKNYFFTRQEYLMKSINSNIRNAYNKIVK